MRHEHMLEALFERQREQHPLVQSVADIVLECEPIPCTSFLKTGLTLNVHQPPLNFRETMNPTLNTIPLQSNGTGLSSNTTNAIKSSCKNVHKIHESENET